VAHPLTRSVLTRTFWSKRADDLVGIDRRLLLGSTVGSCWDRPSALGGIDRRLLLGSTVGSEKRSDA
jgi:hypothetical protein